MSQWSHLGTVGESLITNAVRLVVCCFGYQPVSLLFYHVKQGLYLACCNSTSFEFLSRTSE